MPMTLTLDDDLATMLQKEMERSGQSIGETVRAVLRRGLRLATQKERAAVARPFRARVYHLGVPSPDLDLDNIGELLERVEGPLHR